MSEDRYKIRKIDVKKSQQQVCGNIVNLKFNVGDVKLCKLGERWSCCQTQAQITH